VWESFEKRHMLKSATSLLLLVLFFVTSCRNKKTEKEEASFWNQLFIDSSYSLLYKDKDTTRAVQYFDASFQQSGTLSVYPKAARFGLLANYYYFFTTDTHATAKMIDSALALYDSPELQNHYPRAYVSLLLFGGQIAYRLTQYNKANEYYFKAKTIADAHLSPCERTPFFYNIAMVLYRQQNFSASLNYFKEAYALQETCSPQTTAVILQQQEIQDNIGLCFVQLKNDDSAMIHFDKTLEIANRYKDSLGPVAIDKIYGVVYGNKAKIFMNENRLDEAEKLSLQGIALNDREGYEMEFAQTIKLQLADVYGRKKNYASMFKVLNSMENKIQIAPASQRLEWKRLMANYFEQNAKPDSAISYLKSYTSLSDSIATAQKQLTDADVTRQLKDKQQQLQITILKRDNEVALASLWLTIAISVMAMVIIFLVYHHYRKSKKNLATLQTLNEEINAQKAAREEEAMQRQKLITEAVIRAQENERSLIGLELHDNINQILTTVKLHNEMVLEGVGEPNIILPRTIKYLQECINEIRSLSKRLSAPTLGKITIEESVTDLIESINATSKVKITHSISGFEGQLLKKEIHIGVYRILQEQLHNVLKHSEASEVFIQLKRGEDCIQLQVADNGKGFVVNKTKSGIGLMNMQTRAESLNGTFEVQSQPGKGCKVKVTLPYPHSFEI
jgi:signal transduction histidine kinase